MNTLKEEKEILIVRNYKDTVFRKLFNDRKELLSLYNAMNGSSYENPDELEIVTLDNAIYMGVKNDLAFLIDFHLNLYEHQSTWNPNMPVRFLQYVAKEYEKLLNNHRLYAGKTLKLPAPHFVVFYNGLEKRPEKEILKLSSSFIQQEEPEANTTLQN